MTTTTVFGDVADGWIGSVDTDYATCVAGGASITVNGWVDLVSTEGYSGQVAGYEAHETFMGFDTSGIADTDVVSAAVLSLWGQVDVVGNNYTVEASAFDWSTTVTSADWRTPSQLSALTLLASFATTGWSIAAYNDFTSAGGMIAAINLTGFTRMVVASDQTRLASDNAGTNEYCSHWMGDQTGTSNDPKLVITHAAGATGHPTAKRWGGVRFAGAGSRNRW